MDLKLYNLLKMRSAFLMILFSVLGFGQITESFENGLPSSYNANLTTVSLGSGDWQIANVINGTAGVTSGSKSAQLRSATGSQMITPSLIGGVTSVSFDIVASTASGGYQVNISEDNGQTWLPAPGSPFTINQTQGNRVININSSTVNKIQIYRTSSTIYVDNFTVTIPIATNNPPTVTASSFSGNVGTVFSQQIIASENPTSYSLVNGSSLPNGLSLNTTTGEISGTPVSAGNFITDVTATNSAGTSSSASISFTIGKGTQTIAGFADLTKYVSSPAFTFPLNTENADLPVSYSSSNTAVATVSGNMITIVGMGSANITAEQVGNTNWNALNQQIVLTVVEDPYNGIGRFEKINSAADLTDGFYVVADKNNQIMATNTVNSSGTLVTTNLNVVNNQIVNPSAVNVWKIVKSNGVFTIQNSNSSKFLGYAGSSTDLSSVISASADLQRWNINYESAGYYAVINVSDPSRILKYNASLGIPGFKAYAFSSQLPEVALYKKIETTTWDGTNWSNGSPDAKDVIFTGSYSTTSLPSFTAKNMAIKNGGALEITSGNTINASNITVENGGNLIQKDGSVLNYSGNFSVLKNGTSVVDKYAFWSSPVASQNLNAIYGAGNTPAYITEYNTATDYFVNAGSTSSIFGKGYSIKTPVANASVVFNGTPNTGTQTFTLSTAGNGYNLIGNPYPSNLNLDTFYNINAARISNTFYFWDNTSNSVTTQNGSTTTNIGYATYNPSTQVWVPAPNVATVPSGNVANIGQGFIVKSLSATSDTSLAFTNDMRTANTGSFFNKNTSSVEGKFWLRLNSSYNTNNTFAVAYLNAASDSFDHYDSKAIFTGSDAFYTIADTKKLLIQGKAAFDTDDIVPLGSKHFESGSFVISLVQKEGLFDNGQEIYLHDKNLGTYINLQNQAYSFTENAGEFSDRFEIVYQLNVLSTNEAAKDEFEVYRSGEDFFVRNDHNIEKVEIFDVAGRKVQQINADSKLIKIKLNTKGLYILKAVSQGKEFTKKIIK